MVYIFFTITIYNSATKMNVDKDLGDQINGNPEENVGGPGGGGSASSVVDDFNGFNLFHRFLGDGGVTKGGLEYADKMS